MVTVTAFLHRYIIISSVLRYYRLSSYNFKWGHIHSLQIPPPSAIFGFGVIPENPVRYEVSMTGSIFYQTGVIHVRNGNGVTRSINGVIHLEVANRFTVDAHRHYYETTGLTFNGYGKHSAL